MQPALPYSNPTRNTAMGAEFSYVAHSGSVCMIGYLQEYRRRDSSLSSGFRDIFVFFYSFSLPALYRLSYNLGPANLITYPQHHHRYHIRLSQDTPSNTSTTTQISHHDLSTTQRPRLHPPLPPGQALPAAQQGHQRTRRQDLDQ